MNSFTLIIGNKNYSSWSLRPWLLMKQSDVAFDEIRVSLYQPDSDMQIEPFSPSGRVPALQHGDLTVWDSLAICEYINELFPEKKLWPSDSSTRAHARAICAEMHSGFAALRTHMPMNCRDHFPGKGHTTDVDEDIDRIVQIWRQSLDKTAKDGPFLYGTFTIADAMYAPVALRFDTYDVPLNSACAAYRDTLLHLPAMQEWIRCGREETEVLTQFEPYKT